MESIIFAFLVGIVFGAYMLGLGSIKQWEEGYETAKNTYDNWDKGFKTGWKSCLDACFYEIEKGLRHEKQALGEDRESVQPDGENISVGNEGVMSGDSQAG